MDLEHQAVTKLFSETKVYKVPSYQRHYVWSGNNWKHLWNDITEKAELRLKNRKKSHFTGAIVIQSDENVEFKKFDIIDGQQRLTTFQIILCAIRDLCQKGLKDEYKDNREIANTIEGVGRLLQNDPYGLPEEADSLDIYKLIPKDGTDQKTFQSLVDAETDNNHFDCNNRLHQAYIHFKKRIKTYVDKNPQKMVNLYNTILNSFKVVQITVDSEDEYAKIFESINGTGRALDQFDLLRNNLFLRAGTGKFRDELYEEYWRRFEEEPFWQSEDERARSAKVDAFLRSFLKAKLGKSFDDQMSLFELYLERYHNNLRSELNCKENSRKFVKHEFSELERYAKVYEKMARYDSAPGRRMQFYEDLKIEAPHSFILFLKNESNLSNPELDEVFDIMESFIMWRMLDSGGNEAYATIDNFFSQLISSNREFRVAEFVKFLSGAEWSTSNFVDPAMRRVGYLLGGGPPSLKEPIWLMLRYTLYRIELWKQENFYEGKVENSIPDACQIKQNMGTFLPFGKFPQIPERIMQSKNVEFGTWISIGNLTVRTEEPDDISNSRFVEKKEILSQPGNSKLILNREICKHDNWTVHDIDKRENDLFDCFYGIWPSAEYFKKKYDVIGTEWDSMIESESNQPIRVVTCTGPTELSQIRTHLIDQITGIKKNSKEITLEKRDILFWCSVKAWPEVEPHIKIQANVEKRNLQLGQQPPENAFGEVIRTAKWKQIHVKVVTHSGDELIGTITDYDRDAIKMQICARTVVVYRHGIHQLTIEPIKFVTDAGPRKLAQSETNDLEVKGYDSTGQLNTIEKKRVLFSCSVMVWPDVEPYIEFPSEDMTQQNRQLDLEPTEQFKVDEITLKSARAIHARVEVVTRSGHVLRGILDRFSKSAIYMQINEQMVLVYRHSLHAFRVEEAELHLGKVTKWFPKRNYGFIELSVDSTQIFVHIADVIDENRGPVQKGQKVKFNVVNTDREDRSLHARNVVRVEDELCRGTVTKYNNRSIYGYIKSSEHEREIFVHRRDVSEIHDKNFPLLYGQKVEFSTKYNQKKDRLEARKVMLVGTAPLYNGTIIHMQKNRGFGFIESNEHEGVIFVHVSAVEGGITRLLEVGWKVTFNMLAKPDGRLEAYNVVITEKPEIERLYYGRLKNDWRPHYRYNYIIYGEYATEVYVDVKEMEESGFLRENIYTLKREQPLRFNIVELHGQSLACDVVVVKTEE